MQYESVKVACPNCGESALQEFTFCEACGRPLHALPGAPAAAAPAPPPVSAVDDPVDAGSRVCLCGSDAFDAQDYCEACGRRALAAHTTELRALADYAASASHRGLRHADNQDAVGMLALPDGSVVLAVADGVSTSCLARAAADLACSEALATLRDFASVGPRERLVLAVKRAHAAICKLPHDAAQMAEPQATLVLALVEDRQLWYAWVGDSRLYTLCAGEATQLTQDDSWLNEQLAKGMDPADAEINENAHCITQCLGMRDEEPQLHTGSHALTPGMFVLLCSDGLWNYLETPAALATAFAAGSKSQTLVQRCARLVDHANMAGGRDNITVALFSLGTIDKMTF